MTPDELQQIRARAEVATREKWGFGWVNGVYFISAGNDTFCRIKGENVEVYYDLIANAPADVLALLAEAERLRDQVTALKRMSVKARAAMHEIWQRDGTEFPAFENAYDNYLALIGDDDFLDFQGFGEAKARTAKEISELEAREARKDADGKIFAPFTPEQVERLNQFQKRRRFHPFTCGSGRRTDEAHLDGEGVLVATENGWTCPYCDYTQDWAHSFMASDLWDEGK